MIRNLLLSIIIGISAGLGAEALFGHCDPQCAKNFGCCIDECFDRNLYLCCNGTILAKEGREPQCCGSVEIDYTTQVCCGNGVPHNRTPGQVTWCCGSDYTFDPVTQQCCNNTNVVDRGDACPPVDAQRRKSYVNSEKYPGSQVRAAMLRVEIDGENDCEPSCGKGSKCCATECIDKKTQLCCNGTIFDKIVQSDECCHGQMYDNAKQVCCDGVTHDRQGVTWCCGTESFSPVTDVCCNQVVVPRGSCVASDKV